MKKTLVRQKTPPKEKQDWKSKIKGEDTVTWRLPPPQSETIGGATIAGKMVHSDGILNIQGKTDAPFNLTFAQTGSPQKKNEIFSQGKSGWLRLSAGLKKKMKEKDDDDFLKIPPSQSPMCSPRKKSPNESVLEHSNPTSIHYYGNDSFQRFLDLSTCTTAIVKCLGTVIMPEISLEYMIMKEKTNNLLISHLPCPPKLYTSFYDTDQSTKTIVPHSEKECFVASPDGVCPTCNEKYIVTQLLLKYVSLFCFRGVENSIDIEFNCFSPSILAKLINFSFEITFDRSSLEYYPSSYRSYNRKQYKQYTVYLKEISETSAVLICPIQTVTSDISAGHQIVIAVTCCSKPKVCILRMQMSRLQEEENK